MYIHAHTRTHTRAPACAPAHPCTHPHARTHLHTRAPMHTRMRLHAHTHALASCTHATCERVGMRDVITTSTIALERIRTACNPFLACSPYRCGSTCEKRLVGALINGMHVWTQKRKNPRASRPRRDRRSRANA